MTKIVHTVAALFTAAAAVSSIGCAGDTYADQRPPVDQLDRRDRGLQSKDVVNASDQMSMDFLALPELNASEHRWTIVFTGVRNQTVSARQNLDIFVQRFKSNVARQARGRVQIIANRDTFHDVQGRELEGEREDTFGQGGGQRPAQPAGVQPDFALEAVAMDLANTGTDYYNIEFHLVDLRTREEVWTNSYEVRVAR